MVRLIRLDMTERHAGRHCKIYIVHDLSRNAEYNTIEVDRLRSGLRALSSKTQGNMLLNLAQYPSSQLCERQ